jgi:hypothetical protein
MQTIKKAPAKVAITEVPIDTESKASRIFWILFLTAVTWLVLYGMFTLNIPLWVRVSMVEALGVVFLAISAWPNKKS